MLDLNVNAPPYVLPTTASPLWLFTKCIEPENAFGAQPSRGSPTTTRPAGFETEIDFRFDPHTVAAPWTVRFPSEEFTRYRLPAGPTVIAPLPPTTTAFVTQTTPLLTWKDLGIAPVRHPVVATVSGGDAELA